MSLTRTGGREASCSVAGDHEHEVSARIETLRAGRRVSAVVISGMAGSVSGLIETGYADGTISISSLTEASVSIGEIAGTPAWVMAGGLGRRDEITAITDVMVVPSARARETRSNVLAQVEREEETRKKVRDGWTVDQILAEFGRI